MEGQQGQQGQPQVNLRNTESIETPDGGVIFQQGILLRKQSKFVSGTSEDALIPIPVFFDAKSEKIVAETIPPELRDELKDQTL